jgi:hypothetical protein
MGASVLILKLKGFLMHRRLTDDVTEQDLLALVHAQAIPTLYWECRSVRLLGFQEGDGSYDPHRLTVYLGPDRRVTDLGIG